MILEAPDFRLSMPGIERHLKRVGITSLDIEKLEIRTIHQLRRVKTSL